MPETPSAHPQITVGSALDVGRSRAGRPNQDSLGSYREYDLGPSQMEQKGLLFVVADGMGGAAGGKEASQTAVRTTIQQYYRDTDPAIQQSLTEAIQAANQQIHRAGQDDPALRGMGTTIVAGVFHRNQFILANAGDSRAYLFRQGELHQISVDHSWVQEQVRRGIISEAEAEYHPQRNVLTRNLGNEPEARPDFATIALQEGDTFLLCTDGLWNVVSDEAIAGVLREQRGDAAAHTLMELANEQGGPDNIGIFLLHVERVPLLAASEQPTQAAPPITERLAKPAGATQTARLEPVAPAPKAPPPPPTPAPPALRPWLLLLLGLMLFAALGVGGVILLADQFGLSLPGQSVPATATSLPPSVTAESLPTFTPLVSPTVPEASPASSPGPLESPPGSGSSDGEQPLTAPTLLRPDDGITVTLGSPVTLEWEWGGLYTLSTQFEIGIRRDGVQVLTERVSDTRYEYLPDAPGTYTWDVVVVQGERESPLTPERTFIVR